MPFIMPIMPVIMPIIFLMFLICSYFFYKFQPPCSYKFYCYEKSVVEILLFQFKGHVMLKNIF